jgi:predicted ATPase/DNA-binding SARP family transcriptional activator
LNGSRVRANVTTVTLGPAMEFRVLGPLEVARGGRGLELGGAKQRALLAMLLMHPNEVVSTDRLIDGLWEDDPPESARKALQMHVSHLRKALGKQRLLTRPGGYVLRVSPGELDLERFERCRRESRLDEALGLWRGAPLAEFREQQFAQSEIARLQELRLVCLEDRIARDLESGRPTTVVGELESLVQEHPLRERMRALHILALYRAGRQADALAAYQNARQKLVEELGIEPGRELRDLHQRVLNQDPALDVEDLPGRLPDGAQEEAEEARPRREARKTVTALFIALSPQASGGGRLDPEALRKAAGPAFAAIETAVARYGGRIETVMGDSAMSVFGLPAVHEDDALRAVRAAGEIRDGLVAVSAQFGAQHWELAFRIGVATGEVVTGGDWGPGAAGEPLTLSARLAQTAAQGDVVLDDATRMRVRGAPVEREGEAWRLMDSAVLAESVGRRRSAMVGRAAERQRLLDVFEACLRNRSCQLFTVLGLAGVGKSRLVEEALSGLADRATVGRGRCLPYGEGITFWPLIEAVRDALGLEDATASEEVEERLGTLFRAEDDPEFARRSAEAIGLSEATTGADDRSAVVQTLFEALASSQAAVLVFDDIHWGEATFLDLVEQLADSLREAPVLLLCIARPELLDVRPAWGGGKVNATTILLEPLSDEDCSRLVDNLTHGDELDLSTRLRVVEAAEGNPLFVEEMLALALEGGAASNIAVPPTIQALLAARLDRLGEDERTVIEIAAVEGKEFHEQAIAELAPTNLRPTVPSALAALVHKELIKPDRKSQGGRTYRFRHLLIRDAAYDSIPKEARADLHEHFARWLDVFAAERTTEYEEIVGYHFEQAYFCRAELGLLGENSGPLAREAAGRLSAAGRRAFVRSDAPAGVNLISRAARLLPADDPERVALVPNVRVVQGMGGDMSWAERVLTEAVEAAATTGNRALAAHALVQRGFLRLFTDEQVEAAELIETAQRTIAVFDDIGDELGLARAWRLLAQSHYLDRHFEACVDASERALVHARRAGDRFEAREIVEWLVIALLLGPMPAERAAERCRSLLRESAEDRLIVAQVLGGLAVLTAMQGRIEEAERLIDEARQVMHELGGWLWIHSWHVAFISIVVADPAAAEAEIRPAYEALKRVGEKSHFTTMANSLAAVVFEQGRFDEAGELARECEEANRANDVYSRIAAPTIQARILAEKGELDEAQRVADEAVALAADSDLYVAHGDALMAQAAVLELRGRRETAAGIRNEALQLYERKGDQVSAARAKRLFSANVEPTPRS